MKKIARARNGKGVPTARNGSERARTIEEHARRVFEDSTGVRWTEAIATCFAGWIGPDHDYAEWNQDVRVAKKLLAALETALKHADERGGSSFFEAQIGQDLREFVRWHGPSLEWLAKEHRVWSRDVRLHRYVSIRSFLGLGRRPSLDELTAMSILLGHNVSPAPKQTATAYFRKHRSRLRNVVDQHPKMTTEQMEQAKKKSLGRYTSPVRWPSTEPVRKTNKP